MKSKLLIFGKELELVINTPDSKTPTSIYPKRGESKAQIISRAKKSVKKEYNQELEIKEWTLKNVKSGTTVMLQKAIAPETGKAKGLFRKMIIEVLTVRNKLPDHVKSEGPKNKRSLGKPVPKVVDLDDPIEKAKEERKLTLKEFKKNSVKYKEARKNMRKRCRYTHRTNDETKIGKIIGVLISKDLRNLYYFIVNEKSKKRESCTLDSAVMIK